MPLPGSVLPSGLAVHGCWAALRGSHLGWRPQDSSGVPEGKDKPPRPHPPNIPRSFQGVQPVGVLKRVGKDMPPPGSKVDRLDLLRPAAADFRQVRVTPAPLQWRSLVRSMRLLTLTFVHRLTVAVLPVKPPLPRHVPEASEPGNCGEHPGRRRRARGSVAGGPWGRRALGLPSRGRSGPPQIGRAHV